jgi:hypothetical protein
MNRNAEPENVPEMRLRLLCRTLRDDQGGVALKVQYLKIPYMIRETCKADLARTVAVLPYLRYVDLPERLFVDEQNCGALRQEVQVRCPDLRKMTYPGGAERSLELLSSGQVWRNLEVLELLRLNMDPTILRQVLGYLPQLHALKVTDMKTFNDELFQPNTYLPPFPPLKELIFDNIPNVTAEGLATYLFRTDTQDALKTLSLTSTGIHPSTLQQILGSAPHLTKLSIIESPSASFPATQNVKLLQSQSLEIFHYEITTVQSPNSYSNTSASYYSYLTSSLMSGCLPSLKQLYVRGKFDSLVLNGRKNDLDCAEQQSKWEIPNDKLTLKQIPTSPNPCSTLLLQLLRSPPTPTPSYRSTHSVRLVQPIHG